MPKHKSTRLRNDTIVFFGIFLFLFCCFICRKQKPKKYIKIEAIKYNDEQETTLDRYYTNDNYSNDLTKFNFV